MFWKKALTKRHEIVLASASKQGKPRAIYVLSLGLVDNKLIVGACLMEKTLDNIKKTKRVSIVTKEDSNYFRIEGKTSICSSGKLLEDAIKISKPPLPKSVILVDIDEVCDLTTGKIVFKRK
jgi:hypothetical protein